MALYLKEAATHGYINRRYGAGGATRVMLYETTAQAHEYETRHAGFITTVEGRHVASTANLERLPCYRKSYDGYFLQGYATRYNKPIYHDGRFKMVMPGAFRDYIESGRTTKFLLHQDPSKSVGSTEDGLKLHADEFGVAFRFRFPDSDLGREAKLLAASGMLENMSIGFSRMRMEDREIEGETVCLLHDGVLNEISFLKRGAVGDAYAALIDGEDCGPTLAGDACNYQCICFETALTSN